jgi:hypothetical protein
MYESKLRLVIENYELIKLLYPFANRAQAIIVDCSL